MNDKELERLLFENDDEEKFDIEKWALATVFSMFNEVFSKYTSVSEEERESYFKKTLIILMCTFCVTY